MLWAVAGVFLSFFVLSQVIADDTDPAGTADRSQTEAPAEPAEPDGNGNQPADPNAPSEHQNPDADDPQEDNDSMFPDEQDMVELFDLFALIFHKDYISENGLVDYATLRRKRLDLIRTANQLENLHPAVLMSLDRQQRIAFWINTYNACSLKLIVDNYPIQAKWYMILYPTNSIMQIPGAWTKIFFRIMGLEYNLREIRNDLLLDRYQDPRICFALTNTARGGALLRAEPYTPDRLDEQLDDQTRRFLASSHGVRIDRTNNVIHLSNVFSMNKDVFLTSQYAEILKFRTRKPDERAWLNFLHQYLPKEDALWLDTADPAIRFMDFDWTLNEQ